MPDEKPKETLDEWLEAMEVNPAHFTVSKDGSVKVAIQYAYAPPRPGETDDPSPGPKVVTFRCMYTRDHRELLTDGEILVADLVKRLTDIDPEYLDRLHIADYESLTVVAKGIPLKKFLPTT